MTKRLTKLEKQALVRAANEVLAGEPDEWPEELWTALDQGCEKLKEEDTL